jgi:hypothetical protein
VLNVLQEFPQAIFLGLPMESLIVEEVLSRQTRITDEKGRNF